VTQSQYLRSPLFGVATHRFIINGVKEHIGWCVKAIKQNMTLLAQAILKEEMRTIDTILIRKYKASYGTQV
jgi:hypothetical protein